jgi:hypothetical protein
LQGEEKFDETAATPDDKFNLQTTTLCCKVTPMESNQAAENLQVIRTLMERSAIYRRALAPIMLFAGIAGVAGAGIGIALKLDSMRVFSVYWLGVALFVVAGAFFIARRQALKDHEPFWSPPTRRVSQALMPPLMAGFLFSIALIVFNVGQQRWLFIFPNVLFYGCAVHAAGFFMVRGMRWFAWGLIVLGGVTLLVVPMLQNEPRPAFDHALMGFFFGGLQLAYGVYLYLTERKTAA